MIPPSITALARHRGLHEIWRTPPGLGRLSAVNHTIIGLRFMVTACIFFAIGGILAMLLRAQLATSRSAFMDPDTYNQVFTMHGTVMMFLFAIPMIEGFALYMLPKLLGARDLAFPRLSAYGYWCYLFGGAMLIGAMLLGLAPDSGWFMYTPLSSRPFSPGINSDVWLLGVTFVEISAVCAAVEFIVTILKVRAPGMTLERMPILAWYLLVTAFMMLVGFPPLILGSILLELERAFDLPFFDPTRGGDPLLWQHLFWLFGHPEVYIIFLPAAGMVSTILPVFAGRDLLGYTWIVVSIVALAFLSFGLWVHHMFVVGIPHLGLAFFSAASMLVAVPTGVQIFAWLGTLATGRPRLEVPMLYIIGFFAIFVIGGLTGVMVAVAPFDWQVHDTHFVVAHLHYVLIGGFVFPALAGIYHWLPLVSGRSARFNLGVPAFWLLFIGFNATFLVMHLTGLLGMPRRIYAYGPDTGWDWPNLASSIGSFVMAFGFALVAADLLLRGRFGRPRARNPWGATTLEWATPIPVPSYAFASLPRIASRTPLRDDPALPHRLARGEGYLAEPRHGWQETICIDISTARPESTLVLPRTTFLPLWTALATGLFFGGLLLKLTPLALAGMALTLVLALAWTRSTGASHDHDPLVIAPGETAPPHWETPRPPSWWAMAFTLGANGTLFASLAFGGIFLATVGTGGPPRHMLAGAETLSLTAAIALLVAAAGGTLAARLLPRGAVVGTALALVVALAAHVAAATALATLALAIPAPHDHALGASSLVLTTYALFHATLAAVFAAYGLWRLRTLHLAPTRAADLRTCALWHGYTAATGIAAIALVHALAAGMTG
jgi:cytochrome c oxidase subunit I+III